MDQYPDAAGRGNCSLCGCAGKSSGDGADGGSKRTVCGWVYTQEEFRGLGYSTAAAATVVREVQEQRQIPVWSAGAHNQASLRVAEKLGFVEFGRRRYAVPVSHQRGSH